MAHEVFHAISSDYRHAKSGLMAPVLTGNALISTRLRLDDESAVAFQRRLRRIVERGS